MAASGRNKGRGHGGQCSVAPARIRVTPMLAGGLFAGPARDCSTCVRLIANMGGSYENRSVASIEAQERRRSQLFRRLRSAFRHQPWTNHSRQQWQPRDLAGAYRIAATHCHRCQSGLRAVLSAGLRVHSRCQRDPATALVLLMPRHGADRKHSLPVRELPRTA